MLLLKFSQYHNIHKPWKTYIYIYIHISIKVVLIYKILFSYPSTFIDDQFQKFFFEYMSSSSSPFLPFITDEKEFFLMRHKKIDQPTPRQSQVAMSAATAAINNDQTDEEQNESKESSIKKTRKKRNKLWR